MGINENRIDIAGQLERSLSEIEDCHRYLMSLGAMFPDGIASSERVAGQKIFNKCIAHSKQNVLESAITWMEEVGRMYRLLAVGLMAEGAVQSSQLASVIKLEIELNDWLFEVLRALRGEQTTAVKRILELLADETDVGLASMRHNLLDEHSLNASTVFLYAKSLAYRAGRFTDHGLGGRALINWS